MSSNDSDYAWMIERRSEAGNESSAPLWWDGRDFSPDPNSGVRFARKEDADTVARTHGFQHVTATDHVWMKEGPR